MYNFSPADYYKHPETLLNQYGEAMNGKNPFVPTRPIFKMPLPAKEDTAVKLRFSENRIQELFSTNHVINYPLVFHTPGKRAILYNG